jgi:hypothetical protein
LRSCVDWESTTYVGKSLSQSVVVERELSHSLIAEALVDIIFTVLQEKLLVGL